LKIFYLISPQQKHFRTKFQLIVEATVQGYNFGISTILGNWSCDHLPTTHLIDPDLSKSFISCFSAFLVKTDEILFLGYIQRTLIWTLNAVPDDICYLNEIWLGRQWNGNEIFLGKQWISKEIFLGKQWNRNEIFLGRQWNRNEIWLGRQKIGMKYSWERTEMERNMAGQVMKCFLGRQWNRNEILLGKQWNGNETFLGKEWNGNEIWPGRQWNGNEIILGRQWNSKEIWLGRQWNRNEIFPGRQWDRNEMTMRSLGQEMKLSGGRMKHVS
jgi:hypothetical protein